MSPTEIIILCVIGLQINYQIVRLEKRINELEEKLERKEDYDENGVSWLSIKMDQEAYAKEAAARKAAEDAALRTPAARRRRRTIAAVGLAIIGFAGLLWLESLPNPAATVR